MTLYIKYFRHLQMRNQRNVWYSPFTISIPAENYLIASAVSDKTCYILKLTDRSLWLTWRRIIKHHSFHISHRLSLSSKESASTEHNWNAKKFHVQFFTTNIRNGVEKTKGRRVVYCSACQAQNSSIYLRLSEKQFLKAGIVLGNGNLASDRKNYAYWPHTSTTSNPAFPIVKQHTSHHPKTKICVFALLRPVGSQFRRVQSPRAYISELQYISGVQNI